MDFLWDHCEEMVFWVDEHNSWASIVLDVKPGEMTFNQTIMG